MKSSIAVALIVCGTVLIVVPYIHNTIAMQQVTGTMVALKGTVNLRGDIPKYANFVCMLSGIVMIAVGAIAGRRSGKSD